MPFGLKNTGATHQRLVNRMLIGQNVELYVDDMLVKSKAKEEHLDDLKETFNTLCKYNMKLNPTKCVFRVSSGNTLIHGVTMRDRGKPRQSEGHLRADIPKNGEGSQKSDRQGSSPESVHLTSHWYMPLVLQNSQKSFWMDGRVQRRFEKVESLSCATIIVESIHHRRRTLPLPGSPNGHSQFSLDKGRKRNTTTSVLHQPSLLGSRKKIHENGKNGSITSNCFLIFKLILF